LYHARIEAKGDSILSRGNRRRLCSQSLGILHSHSGRHLRRAKRNGKGCGRMPFRRKKKVYFL